MILAVASMKGGVGKSTLSAMLARFIAEHRRRPVTVVDLDPQRGATILLLGGEYARQPSGPGVYEILVSEAENIPSSELFRQALKMSPYDECIHVVPSDASLARLRGPETARNLLRLALQDAPLPQDETVIVDSSPDVTFCEMAIECADLVFVPITMSHQSGVPTLNTLQAVLRAGKGIGGLVPTMLGHAGWQAARVDAWRTSLMDTVLVKRRGIEVLPAMPFSHAIPAGKWRWGKLPENCLPVLDAMYAVAFGEHALGVGGVKDECEVEERVEAAEGVV
jgi:cellulose biosynthesis protein BcsQ